MHYPYQPPSPPRRRVAVTGMGVLAPNGSTLDEFWDSLLEGRSGVGPITHFDAQHFKVRIGAEVKQFDPDNYVSAQIHRKTERFAQLGVCAAKMALDDARLNVSANGSNRAGVIVGSGLGGILFHETQIQRVLNDGGEFGLARGLPSTVPRICPNAVSSYIAIAFQITGPNYVVSTACSSGTNAIGQALMLLRAGLIDICIVGGVEAPLTPGTFAAYQALRCLSKANDPPAKALKPFHQNRDGFVLGEGAGILVLEEFEHAKARGADMYAELLGYGNNCGAFSMTTPRPDGTDAAAAIQAALEDAHLGPEDVDYVNAHGTATKTNDVAETKALKLALGDRATEVPVSATKSMTGHAIAASGAFEAVAACLSLRHQTVHPTINLDAVDPQCELNHVADGPRPTRIRHVISNSFGIGSNNAVLVFGEPDD